MAQDTIIIDNNSIAAGNSVSTPVGYYGGQYWYLPTLSISTLTNSPVGISLGNAYYQGNLSGKSNVSYSGNPVFSPRTGSKTITSNGNAINLNFNIATSASASMTFADALTTSGRVVLTNGTL